MEYNRRCVLRGAACLSMASAVSSSPFAFLASGQGVQASSRPPSFGDGVRIFFAGAWLFCPDPNATLMRAVAVDMPSLPHIFPYGVWQPGWLDPMMPSLNPNTSANPTSTLIPYAVTVTGTAAPCPDVDTLFSNAQMVSPFSYIPNINKFAANWANPGLRVISLPLPSRIIPAAFRTTALISDKGNKRFKKGPPTGTTGIATTHIFVYDGASSLTFQPPNLPPQTMSHGTSYQADYHFHTVPSFDPGFDHGPCMFENLLSLIQGMDRSELAFVPTEDGLLEFGPGVPMTVDHFELEIPEGYRTHTLASCASGAVGLGNG
jgi:hypothetical protein